MNVTLHSLAPPQSFLQTIYQASTYNAPNNPMFVSGSIWANSIIHYVTLGTSNPPADEQWVTPAAMTYYRTWLPVMAANLVSPKTVGGVNISSTLLPMGNPYPAMHRIEIYSANVSLGSHPYLNL